MLLSIYLLSGSLLYAAAVACALNMVSLRTKKKRILYICIVNISQFMLTADAAHLSPLGASQCVAQDID